LFASCIIVVVVVVLGLVLVNSPVNLLINRSGKRKFSAFDISIILISKAALVKPPRALYSLISAPTL